MVMTLILMTITSGYSLLPAISFTDVLGTEQQACEHFYTAPAEIQSIEIRYVSELDYILVGVLMVDGTFEVLEVKRSEEERFVYKSVYKENLKTLDPEMVEIVDFIPKWGSGANQYSGTCL